MRGAHKYEIIINLIRGLKENIPHKQRSNIPIHVFGITGTLIPILAYLGIDTFDSSTYIQEAKSLRYLEPNTRVNKPILEVEFVLPPLIL